MFEAHVLHLLRRYLGEYVHGLSAEALRISVWKGDVVLKDLKLKAEALNSLKLPVTVKAGFVGTITLKVPWKSLGKEPVIVLIDRVFILSHPAPDGRSLKEEDRKKLFDTKLQQIEEAESATLEAISRSKLGSSPVGNSWLGSLIATIIGNLKITISNVHVRYEDSFSNPGHPFSCGVTLAKLAAVTTDEQGNETFDTSGALDRLRKSLQLERLAMYHDSNCQPWKLDKKWEDLCPKEWIEIFEDGINESSVSTKMVPKWSQERQFVVSPINGVLKYHRLGNQERNDPEIPFEEASLVLTDVSLTITEAQYHDWIRLLEVISRYKTYVDVSHLRPVVSVSKSPRLWWQYAVHATLQQKKVCYRFSWNQIQRLCQIRRRYIELYAGSLQQSTNVDYFEIRDIEKDLDAKVILLWRFLAHAKIESLKSKEAAEQRRLKKGSWFSLSWLSPAGEASAGNDPKESEPGPEKFTKEEWQAINNLLSYQPDEDLTLNLGKESQNMIHHLANISLGKVAARIININQTEILCGRFEQLRVSTKFKHRSIHCDVTLRFYGLSAPEGSLAQSVSSEQKVNAVSANFVHSPVGENVDWRLSATIAPCHATVLMGSYNRVLEFIQRSSAVSPIVAFETATALQNKIEEVTRRAQEQFQMVLEEQSRFALDIDLDAPKVRIPIRTSALSKCDSHFLLDFGHFTLNTKEEQFSDQGQCIYSRFYISGRDIAAFFTDCDSESQGCPLLSPNGTSTLCPLLEDTGNLCSVIDPCGMAVIVDQIKVPHPRYPSTRVSIQVPSLGIHFSPARYCKLMELLDILYCATGTSDQPDLEIAQTEFFPWNPPDLATEARILVWKGIGYSVAAWHPCYLVLSGLYLYVLESEVSHNYLRRSSMTGKQVYEVPSTNVGGSTSCLLVSARGMEIQKALESFNTLVVEFRDEDDKANWYRGLTQATYRASAPFSVDILGNSSDTAAEFAEAQPTGLKPADLVINGALVEMKLSLYGKTGDDLQGKAEETQILEVLAGGGKVHVVRLNGDLTAKMKLHSLKIKDELQGYVSSGPKYLACSVQKNDQVSASQSSSGPPVQDLLLLAREDDDIFTDALPEFMFLSDSALSSRSPRVGDITGCAELDFLGVHEEVSGKGKTIHGDVFYEAEGSDNSDFVSVSFSTRDPSSPDYDGIDAQMNIRMSKLEFFCNRPTLVALIDFGFDLSSTSSGSSMTSLDDQSSSKSNKIEENGVAFVKGLLGYGKGRVVFYLNMDVDSVSVFLNKEDGSELAMFVQESFILDLKVHPSSMSIEGRLGNLRLCDMSLGVNHCWGWLCDIRDQGAESLINFTFSSYSIEDDDYEGYDYSLQGSLSAVRIVFLYRFVQEITAYFMELATPHTEEAIKLVDKVGGFEWLIHKYEIDGSSALKLDLSLDTPIIIVPRNSMSKDFMQLDLGQLQVTNQIRWHGDPEKDPSAVHLDVLDAEILRINMAVGINGSLGKPMIREGQGIHVCVRRSLRDVFRKVPTFSLEVKVGLLHAVMSDKEYNVILDCIYMNLSEEPVLPPSFRDSSSGSKETMRLLAGKVNMNSQDLLSRTVTIIAVEVDHALLELCNGVHEDSPLAHIAIEGLWVSYRMTSLSEADLYVTIPKFYVLDIRPDTKPEMRLMVGSCADAPKQATAGKFPFSLNKSGFMRVDSQVEPVVDAPTSTMFLMDYRWRSSSQSFVLRVQQPRVLVVPDFLLAVAEFFVPALGALTGREELMDPKNDPIRRSSNILLSAPVHKQVEDTIVLSPNRQLIADAIGIEEYTYDGCGKTIRLTEEIDAKEGQSLRLRPIIILGRGKRLRFSNVKIENGSLLRKYTYLSNDSSYSICPEDGVEVLLLENLFSGNDRKNLDWTEEISFGSDNFTEDKSLCNMDSFTLEAQVVSPELTFYDTSKSSLDSFHGEKLLRAKMDLSFMYAAKENDTWIRALVKDLTVEAGSGLIILDPVDISGGYTSVKDKTNVSLVSTDVYAHLSLSVISLLLNLQTQTAAALQFGNIDPLAPCTNFDRICVSSKGDGCPSSLTFWRPRAPSNYVILGDCVTSRPVPPTQAVMAVSITYGRVRKPLAFKLVGLLPNSHEELGVEGHSDVDGDCSLWVPIAPPGYLAMGCVAYKGNEPPPTYIVHCIRSDLVTSTSYSECIFSTTSASNGFSIWRIDNILRSFNVHPSAESCLDHSCYDLHNLLLWNSSWHYFSLKESTSKQNAGHDYGSQQSSSKSESSSGWDVVRSIAKPSNCYISTPNFERIWWDKGSDVRQAISIWRPLPHPGYGILGDCVIEGLEPPALGIVFKADNAEISAKPVQFTKVAHIVSKGLDDAFFWYPIAPPGYASLGCVVTRIDVSPELDSFCCPRMDLVNQANIIEVPISRSLSSKGSQCWSIWKVENQACTFLARSDLKTPSTRLALAIGDSLKPKTRDNITAEMKLRCLSVTVLDSLCGMMTPLVDATFTNIKLATHGRPEAMNAVLISSMAASTFNTHLEAWEPLVEPFDGIFKFETYDTNPEPPFGLGKRARVASTGTLNLNLSAANLDMFAEAMVSWRKHKELEHIAMKLTEEADNLGANDDNPSYAALDEDEFQTLIVENKLGCDIRLKKVDRTTDTIDLLHPDDCTSVWMPPPRYSDRLNVADESREARRYVAVQILEAKGLSVVDDGNSHSFFCALRLSVDSQEKNQQKLFPQSVRTKCVKPKTSNSSQLEVGTTKWNELFIFEVPHKGFAKLEVEVTNLAAKAGKGEVVGATSFSVGRGASTLQKVASVRMLHQIPNGQRTVSHSLVRKARPNSDDVISSGCLVVSSYYFERTTVGNPQLHALSENYSESDVGFWVGLGPQGEWQSFRSFLPLSVIAKTLNDDFVAMEVVMRNGKKHAIFRGLGTVVNDSDVKLDLSVSTLSMISSQEQGRTSEGNVFSSINPGSSSVLPWKSMSKYDDYCLLIRPCVDHFPPHYSWGYAVTKGSGYFDGKDHSSVDQGFFSRQNTMKQGNKIPVAPLRLNKLEKMDLLVCCPATNNKQFWLSISTDAAVLQTELNTPVYDWTISVNSPLKLENRLPCPAEFTIWEKLKEGGTVERHLGIISSRGSAHIYSADVHKPIYLSLFVQGGWVLEKDPVLILDLASSNHASSFWMVHQYRKRRLRVSIERDMGGTAAAPKTIRFFVPYWINNDSSLSLAYRVVEIEPGESSDLESHTLSKAVKSAKTVLRSPSNVMDRRSASTRKNIQVLDVIEDTSPLPSMLSPQDYVGRGGVMLFSSRNDTYLSPRVGIAVAVRNSEIYSTGISLLELEKKQRVDIRAISSDGTYYKLSATLHMTSDRTKVVHFQPHTLFFNRVGCPLYLQQCNTQMLEWIHPADPPKHFAWNSSKVELMKVRLDGYHWSAPFSVETEGVMNIFLKDENGRAHIYLRMEVRSGTKRSRSEVIFRPKSLSSPYRIENRSMFLPIRYRQVDGTSDSWMSLLPNSAASFLWEDLGRKKLLELLVDGTDPSKSEKYILDEISDHQPVHVAGGPSKALRVTILREEKTYVVKISDWMPENQVIGNQRIPRTLSQFSTRDFQYEQSSILNSEFHIFIELAEFGLSIIDHTPEEILYMSVQNLLLSYSTESGSGISRFKAKMQGIQLDNQLPLTPMPVLFRPQRVGDETDYILKFSMTQQMNGSLDLCVYPYIGFQGPENSPFLINIHEPIIWRLHEMIQHINLNRLYDSQSNAVSMDPIIQIRVLNISEIRFKVSMAMSPTQRPVGVLGFWSSLMTALGNTENMQVRINQRFLDNVCMRQSVLISNATSNIKKDLLSQPFQLLSGVDILGNASSALGHMSKGVAALSMDKKFIQSRRKQDAKGVEDFGDVIREGGGALAKGLFRGVTGILTKPLEGAKSSGVEGFVQGVGKGIIGAAAQPVSGVLDLLSKTTEGANAMRMKIASAITSEDQLLRRRLPRAINGDSLLRPYDENKAQGQVIMQLAESGSFFGQVDLFKVRAKFALSDAYEDHHSLPKGKILVVTHRRVILLQQSSNIINQRKFNPARDPCSVLWDVLWDDLATMELTHGKKDQQNAPPSRLILYLQTRSGDSMVRVIKCYRESNQALNVYSSIQQAMNTYGPNQSKGMPGRKVKKPYSPFADVSNAEGTSKEEGLSIWSPQQMPATAPSSSAFGSSSC